MKAKAKYYIVSRDSRGYVVEEYKDFFEALMCASYDGYGSPIFESKEMAEEYLEAKRSESKESE